MEKTPNLSGEMSVSLRMYRILLTLYPSEFRLVYGEPMLQVFRDCCRQALLEAGTAGLLSLWWRTVIDILQTAIEEHSQRGVYMFKSKFVKLSGWALILGGVTLIIGVMAISRPAYNLYNARSLPLDQYANAIAFPLLSMSFLLICVGFIGLFLRYGQRAGNLGRYSLIVGIISSAITMVGLVLVTTYNTSLLWELLVYSISFQFMGLVLFGIASLRQCTLPRWNGLPIIAGVWLPLLLLTRNIYEMVVGYWPEYPAIDLVALLFTIIGLAGLGYLLQADMQPANITTTAV